MQDCNTLDDYLSRYGGLLGRHAQESLAPLHVPERDPLPDFSALKRQPFPAQQHVIAGLVAALNEQKSVMLCAEVGSGKTIMAMVSVHCHAMKNADGYRALLMVPGHLTKKWERELRDTIPGCHVTQIEHCHQLNQLRRRRCHAASGVNWYIIARDRAKLGAKWGPAAVARGKSLHCPKCGVKLTDKDGLSVDLEDLAKRQQTCHGDLVLGKPCGEQLWSYYGKQRAGLDRFEPAKYIHKRMRGYFDYLVLDEQHELKASESAQGNAAGSLIAAAKKVIGLTGTLIGGYSEHVRPIMFRMCPRSLVAEGLGWKNSTEFNRRYGRIERTVRTREGGADGPGNRMSRGNSRSVTEAVKPGIMPTLFGRHLLGNSVYLSLDEVSDQLPVLREFVVPVQMDAEQAAEYQRIEKALRDANKELLVKGNKALLGAMLMTLLAYPDCPHDWDWVGYWSKMLDEKVFNRVVKPADLDAGRVRPKEAKLLEIVASERKAGRQVWVFVEFTDTRPVQARLVQLLGDAGFKVGQLRASVPMAKREEWIREKGPDFDVVVSHPKLVETGLDLFDKHPNGCNFCTLIFYEQ